MIPIYTGGAIWALIPEVFEDLAVAVWMRDGREDRSPASEKGG